MSDVASLELCKELYELSGWNFKSSERYHIDKNGKGTGFRSEVDHTIPAYDLGYLLRKLPLTIKRGGLLSLGIVYNHDLNKWEAGYLEDRLWWSVASGVDYTPEDALCKLAIKLIKEGVIEI